MNQEWCAIQVKELGEAMARQGFPVTIPCISNEDFHIDIGSNLAPYIDHTLLKPEATLHEIKTAIEQAARYQFASVCLAPRFVALAKRMLVGKNTAVCTVIGFPLGASTTVTKMVECRDAVANGADELDMVLPISCLKHGDYVAVYKDIQSVVEAAQGRIVKVILETSLLTKEEIGRSCLLAKMAGASFVKTSTGFSQSGASEEDIQLMRKFVGSDMGVKASGGIRDRQSAMAMLQGGASRIGTSAGVAIVQGTKGEVDAY